MTKAVGKLLNWKGTNDKTALSKFQNFMKCICAAVLKLHADGKQKDIENYVKKWLKNCNKVGAVKSCEKVKKTCVILNESDKEFDN